MVSVVLQESANNFTNLSQSIDKRPIASVIYSPNTPEQSNLLPKRAGEIYIQISEGSEEHKLRMWIGVAVTNNAFIWEEATGVTTPIPETVARTDKINDFQPYEQTISGNQIMSFVDGGDQNPGQSGIAADYDGQFYIAVKTLESGQKDVAIWVASGNQWLPLAKEGVDTTGLAKLSESNVFTNLTQMIGPAEDGRIIGGTRIKRGTVSPIADASWLAKIEGETTIFFNTGTDPMEVSIWTAISTTGVSPVSQWKMTWSSKGSGGGDIDTTNLAKLNERNTFIPFQQIGGEGNTAFINTSRAGLLNPSARLLPLTDGELYVQQINETNHFKVWIATAASDIDSWICIYNSSEMGGIEDRLTNLETYDDAVQQRMDLFSDDLDGISRTVGLIDSDVTSLDTDLGIVKTDINNLDGRVNANELKIAALETHHNTNQETFAAHEGRLDVAEIDIDNIIVRVGTAEGKVTALETTVEPIPELVTKTAIMEESIAGMIGFQNNHNTRIGMLEDADITINRNIGNLTSQVGTNTDNVGIAQRDATDAYNLAVTNGSIATNAQTRVGVVEGKLPETLTADKIVSIKSDGTAMESSSVSITDVNTLVSGSSSGNTLISLNCIGGGTIFTSANVTAENMKSSNVLFATPNNTSREGTLPDIVSNSATSLNAVQIREGRTTYLINQSSTNSILIRSKRGSLTDEQKVRIRGTDRDSFTLGPYKMAILQPCIFSGDVRKWVMIAVIDDGCAGI